MDNNHASTFKKIVYFISPWYLIPNIMLSLLVDGIAVMCLIFSNNPIILTIIFTSLAYMAPFFIILMLQVFLKDEDEDLRQHLEGMHSRFF